MAGTRSQVLFIVMKKTAVEASNAGVEIHVVADGVSFEIQDPL